MAVSVTAQKFIIQFRCVGAECPDDCCYGWNMQVGDATREQYKQCAPELLESLTGSSGEYRMNRDAKTDRCVKFSDGLCDIHKKYGEEFLGDACYFYPRITRSLGNSVVMTATLSCPEIARLALFNDDAFLLTQHSVARLPHETKDYLPPSLSAEQAMAMHQAFVRMALDKTSAAERSLLRMLVACESLKRITAGSWPEAIPFYISRADSGLPPAEGRDTDTVFLLQALCGLVTAAKKVQHRRLMKTIEDMEQALHVSIRRDTLVIVPLPDSKHAVRAVQDTWRRDYRQHYAPLLRRYLAMQILQAFFPFGGFGDSITERIAVIGIRLATVKLALMCACALAGKPLAESETIRIVQSLSRFLDHLSGAELSLKIYQETGWINKPRLRALLGDGD